MINLRDLSKKESEIEYPVLFQLSRHLGKILFNPIEEELKKYNALFKEFSEDKDSFRSFRLKDYWVAGGYIRDYFSEDIYIDNKRDIDLYFQDHNERLLFFEVIKRVFKITKIIELNNVSKIYIDEKNLPFNCIDLIKIYFPAPSVTIDNFDFTVTMFAMSKDKICCYHENAFMDLLKKRLVIHRLPFPLSSLQRLQKYIQKGYFACNGNLLTLAKALSTIDWNDYNQNTIQYYPN